MSVINGEFVMDIAYAKSLGSFAPLDQAYQKIPFINRKSAANLHIQYGPKAPMPKDRLESGYGLRRTYDYVTQTALQKDRPAALNSYEKNPHAGRATVDNLKDTKILQESDNIQAPREIQNVPSRTSAVVFGYRAPMDMTKIGKSVAIDFHKPGGIYTGYAPQRDGFNNVFIPLTDFSVRVKEPPTYGNDVTIWSKGGCKIPQLIKQGLLK